MTKPRAVVDHREALHEFGRHGLEVKELDCCARVRWVISLLLVGHAGTPLSRRIDLSILLFPQIVKLQS